MGIQPGGLLLISGFSFLMILSNGIYHKIALGVLDVNLSITEWMGIPSISFIISCFIPFRADLMIKGVYYKEKCGLAYGRYLSFLAGGAVITLMMDALHLAVGIAAWGVYQGSVLYGVTAVLILCVCVLFPWILFRYQHWFRKYVPFKKNILPVIDGFMDLVSVKSFIMACVGTLAFSNIMGIFRIYAAAQCAHVPFLFFQAVLYDWANRFSGRIMLIPGNIGVT
ncbi:MAG: hypothetical protein IJK52_09510, partial [Oscillospiraceae bacterium]|nr:hypothetical protein [Oscillospiraceae bacterium]